MHLFFVAEAQPETHPKFLEWLRNRKYKYKGKLREGIIKPFVREVKIYDVNIYEEKLPELLADLKNFNGMGHLDLLPQTGIMSKLIQKITPLEPIDMSKIERNPIEKESDWENFGFLYINILGKIKDNKNRYEQEEL